MHHSPIEGGISNAQAELLTTLTRTIDFPKATQTHILFGDDEAVIGLDHNSDAALGIFAQFAPCDQDAVALTGTTPHTATELMQLRQPEAVCPFDDHHRGVGYVHTDLDDGGG